MIVQEAGMRFMTERTEVETKIIMDKLEVVVEEAESIRNNSGDKGANRLKEILDIFTAEIKNYEDILRENNLYRENPEEARSNKFMIELQMLRWIYRFFKSKELFVRMR